MKYINAELVNDVVSSYDQTKTTIAGRVFSKTLSGQVVLGPPVTKFVDVFTDTALTPTGTFYVSSNGRMFVLGAIVNGTTYDTQPIALYDFDLTTGVYAYVGQILVQLPNLAATTTTVRGLRVLDTGTTGWKILLSTVATVTINGGLFLANKIDKADFIPVSPPTIPMATSSDAKAVYFLQDPSNIGVGQLQIASAALIFNFTDSRAYVHNGVAATHQYYVYDISIAPTWASAAVSIASGTPGVITDVGHTYLANDPIIVTSLSGGTGLTNNTVYFVRNPVAGTSYELSATSGGASIAVTLVGTAIIGRAWGTTGSNWLHKTGNLPALVGTLLLNDSENYALPVNSPTNGGVLNGNACAFFSTSTNLYLGLLSELTSGVTTWPSLSTSNILGSTNQITAPTNAIASWSNTLDAATYITNTSKFITKQLQNNSIISITGALNNQYYETFNPDSVDLGFVTISSINNQAGWTFAAGSTVGQRGIIASDFRSDQFYDYSYIVTKVLDNPNAQLAFYTTYEQLFQDTGNIKLQYRTSGFGSITGGWVDLPAGEDLVASVITSNSIQFKILFKIQSEESSSPAQVHELLIGVTPNNATSDYWEFSRDNSDNTSPSRSAFRLKKAFATSVPQLFYRAYDLSDALLVNHNTTTNAANFEYSTDDGMSWLPLGTIPNTIGTLVRYTFSSPPGVKIRPGLKES